MKSLIITAVALLSVTGSAMAQGVSATGTASASLNVVSGITIAKNADVDFGNIAQGQGTITLAKDGTVSGTTGLTNADGTVGKFTVSGYTGAEFSISTAAVSLTGDGDAISFTPSLYGNGTDDASAATSATSGTIVDGSYYIYVGGSLAVPDDQAVGAYTGTVSVDVAYTSI